MQAEPGSIIISTTGHAVAQQTLTAEAAAVLKQAVTEACKRGHVQATPLHVAATLLASPNSPLRRACLQTHDAAPVRAAPCSSSHLPQCRALELCFNIALERLQATHVGPGLPCNGAAQLAVPSYSNALTAALKRAQAHQRRGYPPDQVHPQQQPLLAVKVELQQLIISILDDPSVSRVMREAGFRSTDVKRHLEEMSMVQQASHVSIFNHHSTDAAGRLQPLRTISANVMDHTTTTFSCVNGGILPTPSILGAGFPLSHHLARFSHDCSVQLHGLRPLSWLHDSPHQSPMQLLKLGRITGAPAAGPANLSAVRSTSQETSGTDSLALSLVLPSSDAPSKLMNSIPQHIVQGGGDEDHKLTCCSECSKNYEKEALLLQDHASLKQLVESPQSCSSHSVETPSKVVNDQALQAADGSHDQPVLPLWLQKALPDGSKRVSTATAVEVYDKPVPLAKRLLELRKKWNGACKCLHSERLQAGWDQAASNMVDMHQVQQSICRAPQLCNQVCGNRPLQGGRTLSLLPENSSGQAPAVPSSRLRLRMNPEALGELCKGLVKKVGWQPRVISTVANTVLQCRSGLGKRTGSAVSWLLFLGHDRPGKRLMAEALAELSFAGVEKKFTCFTFGKQQQQQDVGSPTLSWSLGLSAPPRGKMPVDELADAVRHNPSSLFYLEDVEQADPVFRSSLLRAMSSGRLMDGSGREVSFSSAIVVMTSNVGMDHSCTIIVEKGELTPQSANEDCAKSPSFLAERQRQGYSNSAMRKRKGGWDDANVESYDGPQPITSKRANYILDLDLNLAVEADNYVGSRSPVSHLSVWDIDFLRSSCPSLDQQLVMDIDEKAVLSGAREQLGGLCDLVDAVVVFAPP